MTSLRNVFDGEYPTEDFRDLNVSIEFPVAPENYPGIWVDFEPVGELETVGISHVEWAENEAGDAIIEAHRWRFGGYATMTVVAMTSLQRDRLFDEVVKVLAFGPERAETNEYRATIENNDLLAVNLDFDRVRVGGFATTQGTPWGTDEVVYEATLSSQLIGEFVSEGIDYPLVPLSRVIVVAYAENEPDPTLSWPPGRPWQQ